MILIYRKDWFVISHLLQYTHCKVVYLLSFIHFVVVVVTFIRFVQGFFLECKSTLIESLIFPFFQSDASTISPITIVDVDFFLNTNNNLCMILFVFIIIIYNWLIVYLIIKLKEWERFTSHFLFDCLWPTTFGHKIETKFIEIK